MNRKTLVVVAVVASLPFAAPFAQAQSVSNTPEARAQEAAKKGPDALRRFIERTRMIYGLNFYDFYKPVK